MYLRNPHLIDQLSPGAFGGLQADGAQRGATDGLARQEEECALQQQQPDVHDPQGIVANAADDESVDAERNTSADYLGDEAGRRGDYIVYKLRDEGRLRLTWKIMLNEAFWMLLFRIFRVIVAVVCSIIPATQAHPSGQNNRTQTNGNLSKRTCTSLHNSNTRECSD